MRSLLLLIILMFSIPVFSQRVEVDFSQAHILIIPRGADTLIVQPFIEGSVFFDSIRKQLIYYDDNLWQHILPSPRRENKCNNNYDDDGDTLIDCDDPDCDFCCPEINYLRINDVDSVPCYSLECDPIERSIHITLHDCDDRNACTYDYCVSVFENGWDSVYCIHDTILCDDGNPCTINKCDPERGCYYTPVDCDDNNPCTIDYCNSNEEGGCRHSTNQIYCESPVLGTTVGHTNEMQDYDCLPGGSPTAKGPEIAYYYATTADSIEVTVNLTDYTGGKLDLFVLKSVPGNACDPKQCVGWNNSNVSFTAKAGIDYWIVVDTETSNDAGNFRLSLSCGQGNQ